MIGPVYFPAQSSGERKRSNGRAYFGLSLITERWSDERLGIGRIRARARNAIPIRDIQALAQDSDPGARHTPERRHRGSSHGNAGHEKRVEEARHETVLLRIRFTGHKG